MLLNRTVVCSGCQQPLHEPENVMPERRTPCEACGSIDRAVQVVTAGFIRSVDDLCLPFDEDGRTHSSGGSSPPPEDTSDRLVIVERYFDRDHNIYRERVEDEASGKVLWQVESPLDRHLGT
jgi:hypothetical protein